MRLASWIIPIRVGWFLAIRQVRRAGKGVTALIVSIMLLTFLNLVVVSGILIGLVEGSSVAYRGHYSGDVLVQSEANRDFIPQSAAIVSLLRGRRSVEAVSARYLAGGRVEANYRTSLAPGAKPDAVGATIVGIDPTDENAVTDLAGHLVEGKYLDETRSGEILIGSSLLESYTRTPVPGQSILRGVGVGSRVRLSVGGQVRELTVRGVVKSKISGVNQRVFLLERELRPMIGREDLNVGEIAVKLVTGADPADTVAAIRSAGLAEQAIVQGWEEAQGSFFLDLQRTFAILSNVIGSIAVAVAAMTVFIVVLINVLSRKRFVGILKGIGICGRSITLAYVFQALFYAACGVGLGALLLLALIKPYFDANPIDFPFSDGILAVTTAGVFARVALLLAVTAAAGYFPARYIVSRNTLNTILGR